MSKIKTINGDLFAAPKGSIIAHACNCQGMWGSGIAKTFAQKFPKAFEVYRKHCQEVGPEALLGTCFLIPAGDYTIACLFTSIDYGSKKDGVEKILASTLKAVGQLLEQNVENLPIAMCKINAGLFAVPWKSTLYILEQFDKEMTIYEQ